MDMLVSLMWWLTCVYHLLMHNSTRGCTKLHRWVWHGGRVWCHALTPLFVPACPAHFNTGFVWPPLHRTIYSSIGTFIRQPTLAATFCSVAQLGLLLHDACNKSQEEEDRAAEGNLISSNFFSVDITVQQWTNANMCIDMRHFPLRIWTWNLLSAWTFLREGDSPTQSVGSLC